MIILFMIGILVYKNYRHINKETQYEKYVIDNFDEKQHQKTLTCCLSSST